VLHLPLSFRRTPLTLDHRSYELLWKHGVTVECWTRGMGEARGREVCRGDSHGRWWSLAPLSRWRPRLGSRTEEGDLDSQCEGLPGWLWVMEVRSHSTPEPGTSIVPHGRASQGQGVALGLGKDTRAKAGRRPRGDAGICQTMSVLPNTQDPWPHCAVPTSVL
jgi:hypothetical protein